MKIALVHDNGLMVRGGGEQVALWFHKTFPEAPIYTQCYQPHLTFPEFKDCDIRPSWLQSLAKTDAMMKSLFFPLGIWAMESHDLTAYDVVLMSGNHCAKYVKVSPDALVISYTFTPFRLAWEPTSYAQYNTAGTLKKTIFDLILGYLRRVDYRYGQRPTHYIAMTEETAGRVRQTYTINDNISIINPPVTTKNFYVSDLPKKYFLVVSRLEYYKKIDLIVHAFNKLGYPLIIVGKGIQEEEVKRIANPNITFMSGLSAKQLADLYAGCRAFIFPQHEDYGITPLEANSAGRPVIAYGAGGVLATQIPVLDDPSCATAVFFEHQSVDHLITAVQEYERLESLFDSYFIRKHAESFDEELFIAKIREFVTEKYHDHQKLPS